MDIVDGTGLWVVTDAGGIPPIPPGPVPAFGGGGTSRDLDLFIPDVEDRIRREKDDEESILTIFLGIE